MPRALRFKRSSLSIIYARTEPVKWECCGPNSADSSTIQLVYGKLTSKVGPGSDFLFPPTEQNSRKEQFAEQKPSNFLGPWGAGQKAIFAGCPGRRFVRTVKKNPNADLFVSFVGAPKLSGEEIAELSKKPKFIAESRSGDNLPDLFEQQLIQVAIVSRFQFPAPGPEQPRTAEEWFTKRYQILTSESARSMGKSE